MIDVAQAKGCKCGEEIPIEECVRCICELGARLIADLPDLPEGKRSVERSVQPVLHTDMQRNMGEAQGKQVGVKRK